jgi:hypothetical protein
MCFTDEVLGLQLEDLTDDAIHSFLFDGQVEKLKSYTTILQLLHFFRREIMAVCRSLRRMHMAWARTYVGKHSEMLDRFDRDTQCVLLENWDKLLLHGEAVQGRLLGRIRETEERAKDLRLGVGRVGSMHLLGLAKK